MSCGCSLCAIRAGASAPKLDGCRCPDQIHVNRNCFMTPPPVVTISMLLNRLGYSSDRDAVVAALHELIDHRVKCSELKS